MRDSSGNLNIKKFVLSTLWECALWISHSPLCTILVVVIPLPYLQPANGDRYLSWRKECTKDLHCLAGAHFFRAYASVLTTYVFSFIYSASHCIQRCSCKAWTIVNRWINFQLENMFACLIWIDKWMKAEITRRNTFPIPCLVLHFLCFNYK